MPISPQITITPENIVYKSFDITAVSYTSSTATYTATGHTLAVNDIVMITGLAPDGYNGTYTITAKTTNTFTVANTTNTALTDQTGNVYWADPTEYEYTGGQKVAYLPDNGDVDSIIADNATVAAAYANANTALANAATAYTTAVNSLQASAYAIQNPTTKQLTSIDATGLTVYVNSPTTGARVVMNSAGLAGYNSSGTATFSITASTGAATFAGDIVTGARIIGGTMNIGGNAIIDSSGYLTATGATITGTIYANAGYIGSAANGWNFTSSGYLTNNGGSTILYPTTTPGGNATTYSVFTDRGVYAERLFITGTQTTAVYSSGGLYALGALNVAASSGTPAFAVNTSGAITAVTSIAASGTITTTASITGGSASPGLFEFLSSSGRLRVSATYGGTSGGSVMYVTSAGLFGVASSTERKKKDIESYQIDEDALLSLDTKTFRYKDEIDDDQFRQFGFIAEEADALGLFELVGYDKEGLPDRIAYDRIPTFLVPIIRKLKQQVQDQEARIKVLEGN